jgi:hypothetical protein
VTSHTTGIHKISILVSPTALPPYSLFVMVPRLRLVQFTSNFAMISIKSIIYPNSLIVPAQNGVLAPADGRMNLVSTRKFRYCSVK